ncbi:hypothetical protein [Solibacillus sp. CAU 1738]|uniref:hypothetical protein n=1 Tax=Solibacillus sp. CAU 1738 TaxID=3140363 RepID=UPI0032602847
MKEQKMTDEEIMVKNKAMENQIISWGLPKYLKSNKSKIIFKFDDEGLTDTSEKGYKCEGEDVKFCLYDQGSGKVLFSMHFFKRSSKMQQLLSESCVS